MSDADAADDVLQDVFAKTMRHGQVFCTLDNPGARSFRFVANVFGAGR